MARVLIRDVEDEVMDILKERARKHSRSLQSELKNIIENAARLSSGNAARTAARIRKKLAGRQHFDSAELLAEDRSR